MAEWESETPLAGMRKSETWHNTRNWKSDIESKNLAKRRDILGDDTGRT